MYKSQGCSLISFDKCVQFCVQLPPHSPSRTFPSIPPRTAHVLLSSWNPLICSWPLCKWNHTLCSFASGFFLSVISDMHLAGVLRRCGAYSAVYIRQQRVYSSAGEHLGCFQFLATPNNTAANILFFFNFYWSIVDLQCCVGTEKWTGYTYTYIHSFRFFFHTGHYRVLSIVPCAIQ